MKDIHHKSDQWYLALVVLTSDESQGMMTRSGSGNGAEALRMLVERWWPAGGGEVGSAGTRVTTD